MRPRYWRKGLPGLLAIALGLLYWPLEAVIHVCFFGGESLTRAMFHPSPNEAWMRALVVLIFIGFGLYLYRLLQRQDSYVSRLEMLKQALDHAGEGIIITDRDGTIEYVNRAFEKTTGYSVDEALGNNPRMLQSGRQGKDFYARLWESIRRDGRWQGRIWNRRKDGEEYPEQLHICAIRDASGEVCRYIGVFFDISEQLRLEEQLRHSQKMEAISTLVGGIAHDFNNILTSMTGNLFLIRMELEELDLEKGPELQAKLDLIENEGFRAAGMIQHLLAFARKRIVQMRPYDFTRSMRRIVALARPSLGRAIRLDVQLGEKSYEIKGDENQLEEVMINLLNNAADAVRDVEYPCIVVRLRELHALPESLAGQRISMPCLCLQVEDNGKGVASEDLSRVFEPFFTTKDVGCGTGLGLAMVYGAVQMHGGCVEMESEQGKGCRVSVYLPLHRAEEEGERESASATTSAMDRQRCVLLLAEDIQQRTILEQQLRGLGCDVLTVRSWEEAEACLRDQVVHLLLAEDALVEPREREHWRKTYPGQALVLLTDDEHSDCGTACAFLRRPVTLESLKRVLRELSV